MSDRFPVVDLAGPREQAVQIIKSACHDLGFFQVINHSIKPATLEGARGAAREFFALPLEKKKAYPLSFKEKTLFGYAAVGAESADVANVTLTGQEAIPDLMESFQVGDLDYVETKYPSDSIKEPLEAMYKEQRVQALNLLELLAEGLGEPVDTFTKDHTNSQHRSVLRITRYPALKNFAGVSGAGVSRISPHRDLGTITVLFQDDQGGLEVQDPSSGEWVGVPPVEGAAVINIGNVMTRWTNAVYRSSIHRVITNEKSDANDRISVIMFVNPCDSAVVGPLPSTVTEERPAKYEHVDVSGYMSCKLTQLFDPNARDFKGKCKYDD